MKRTKALIASVLLLAAARETFAASAGAEPFNFLFLDANARPVAMGGAYTALANDANALLYNPAGLAAVSRNEATFMHNQHFEGITQEYAGFAHSSGWGLNLNFLNSGSVPKTTISNPNGTGLGETRASDLALGGGYGRVVSESLALGAGVKLIRESIAGYSGQTFALDMGALYSTPRLKNLTLGAALQNVGPGVRFQSRTENLPLNLRAGAAYGFTVREQDGVATLDITKERSENFLAAIGAETRIARIMSLRLGFSTRNDAGPGITAGIGWALRDFDLDYAFVPYGDLGVSHRLSVTWRFGEDAREAQADRTRYEERKPRRKTDRTSPRKPPQADKRP